MKEVEGKVVTVDGKIIDATILLAYEFEADDRFEVDLLLGLYIDYDNENRIHTVIMGYIGNIDAFEMYSPVYDSMWEEIDAQDLDEDSIWWEIEDELGTIAKKLTNNDR